MNAKSKTLKKEKKKPQYLYIFFIHIYLKKSCFPKSKDLNSFSVYWNSCTDRRFHSWSLHEMKILFENIKHFIAHIYTFGLICHLLSLYLSKSTVLGHILMDNYFWIHSSFNYISFAKYWIKDRKQEYTGANTYSRLKIRRPMAAKFSTLYPVDAD